MPYLLNLVYLLLILLTLPWLAWQSIRKGKYREGFAAKFLGRAPRRQSDRRCVWLHAVSVGEVNLLAPLLGALARERPEWECVISTTTMTGMALAKRKYPRHAAFYCPLDFSWAARAAMRRVRPDLVVLAETELWPNLIRAARESGARVAIVNGRLSDHSFRGYSRIRPLVARVLRQIDLIAVQDESYAERFRRLGARPEKVAVTGSMKYDGAQTDRGNPATERLRRLAGFAADDVVFLAGSTQEPEEEAALAAFRALHEAWSQLRLVLVPRHPDRFESVAKLLDQSGLPWQRRTALESEGLGGRGQGFEGQRSEVRDQRSEIRGQRSEIRGQRSEVRGQGSESDAGNALRLAVSHFPPDEPRPAAARILLVDTVGELGAWWGTAQIAFVGGSLGNRGGQNMIEPAAYGAAVCFGPNTWNFRDIVTTMLDRQAAVIVRTPEDLAAFVRRCLAEPEYAIALGAQARTLVAGQLGASERTFRHLVPLIEGETVAGQRWPVAAVCGETSGR